MPSAADDIRAAIAVEGGPISFRQFMELALYGPHGFYSGDMNVGRAGRRGDFITSPEVGPLFGTVVARMIDNEWGRMGKPSSFTIVDAGAGPGTLARSIFSAKPECRDAMTYIAVETSARQREMHPDFVVSVGEMPTTISNGIVIANELLDNLPFELWVFDDGWRQAYVDAAGSEFVEVLKRGEAPLLFPTSVPHGTRLPWQNTAQEWLQKTLDSLSVGSIVVFDYCTAITAQLVTQSYRDWLRTYVAHNRGAHYLRQPGEQDITVQVLIDQLRVVREPDAVRTQAQFLDRWGIYDLVAEGKRVWEEHASQPNLEAMRMRSRVSEAEALMDPHGLGAFTVVEWVKN